MFTYRDVPTEEFSSKYWFKAPPPSADADWMSLVNSVKNLETNIFPNTVTFQRAYGYNDDDPKANAVFVHDWNIPGPAPPGTMAGTGAPMAGDQAGLVEWKTEHKNTRGKLIYLRKYLHAGHIDTLDRDRLDGNYITALQTYGDGIRVLHGGLTNASSKASSSNGQDWPGGSHTAIGTLVSPWVTTRTLKRRGPRPKTQALAGPAGG